MDRSNDLKLLKKKKNLTLLPLQINLRYFGDAMAGFFFSYKWNSSFCHFKSHAQNVAHLHIKYNPTNLFN